MVTAAAPPSSPGPFLDLHPDPGVAALRFQDPERPVNVLTAGVMHRLAELLEEVREEIAAGRIRGLLVVSGKEDGFIAGADLEAIAAIEGPDDALEAARRGQALFLEVERLGIPTLAAIHGPCVGGGLELALACRHRVASDHPRTKLGLPEVQLGILPAWGGTTRLPRLVGLQSALDLLLTGKTISPSRARRIGLVEAVLPHPDFRERALAYLLERVHTPTPARGAVRSLGRRLLEDTAPGRRIVLKQAGKQVISRTGGHYPAPIQILEVVRKSAGASLERALEVEALAASELIGSPVNRNLIHIFHLREGARKGAGLTDGVEPLPVKRMAVVGAGVMGGGIAHLAADRGVQVRIKDIRHEAVTGALKHAGDLFRKGVERKKLKPREAAARMERISGGLGYEGFGAAELVVEAVVERMEVKRSVLAEVEARIPQGCVLATNTSTLSIDEMAGVLKRPENFGGMHFFNPVDRMPLVEVIRGARTSPRTVSTIHALAVEMGKVPVVVRDGPGFLVNRILGPYLNEAGHLLAEGASVEAVDAAAREFGMPMGPLRLIDEVGIDVMRHAGEVLYGAFGDRLEPAAPLVALGESGRGGRKAALGIYGYDGSGKELAVDPGIYGVLGSSVPATRREVESREIRARLVLTMVNEAARILEDGIVERAADVDLGMIMGTGFPPFRGGLLRYADQLHPRTIVDRLQEYAGRLGARFRPAGLFRELAEADMGFYQRFP